MPSQILRWAVGFVIPGLLATSAEALIVNAPQPITHVVTVQPIVVSDDDGSNTAEFFGTLSQQVSIEGFVDDIWAQAGIDVGFLAPNTWNSTFANEGAPGFNDPRPTSDLGTIVADGEAAGKTHALSSVINMFFVNIPAGFSALSEFTVAGLAYVGGNGISQYVGSNLLNSSGSREIVASVVAHEIGHNLGLFHIVEAENLMQSSSQPNQGERLNSTQIATALASSFSVEITPVPVPGAVLLLASGLVVLARPRRQ